ncbi:hypothetical protein ABT218_28970, partial [Streptomyces sp. NPDC001455]|uniref:hypothetical protein n=1 Tax=Streptomyces sp. NPDC001455 TaxID=3154518 RepID=UPI00331C8F66
MPQSVEEREEFGPDGAGAVVEEFAKALGRLALAADSAPLVLRPERFTGSRRPARHLAALSYRPSTSRTRAI